MNGLLEKLEKLVVTLTEAAAEARTYYARLNGTELPLAPGKPEGEQPAGKPRGGKKEKAAAAAAAPDKPLVDPNMTAEQSAKEVYEVATAFVERFKKDTPDGRTQALAILKEKFNAAAIAELKEHAQRVQFIGALKAKMADADKVAA